MRSIVLTYPGFVTLPKGIKQLLVASEHFYFDEARPVLSNPGAPGSPAKDYWGYGALATEAKPFSSALVTAGRG